MSLLPCLAFPRHRPTSCFPPPLLLRCAPLHHTAGEFVITHPNVQVPKKGNIYSINEGNSVNWDVATKRCQLLRWGAAGGSTFFS